MRASITGYLISLVHLFSTSEVFVSLTEALVRTDSSSVFVKKNDIFGT